MVETVSERLKINGTMQTLKIKKDLTWGEFQEVLVKFASMDEKNPDPGLLLEGLHTLLEKTIVDSPIDPLDRTALFQMSAGEVTKIVGVITKHLPLETYLQNMGLGAEGSILGLQKNSQKKSKT